MKTNLLNGSDEVRSQVDPTEENPGQSKKTMTKVDEQSEGQRLESELTPASKLDGK